MVVTRVERMVRRVRRWVPGASNTFHVGPDLSDQDQRQLRVLIDDTIAGRGGEVAARRRAGDIGTAFLSLNESGRRRFFELLANDYGADDEAVNVAIETARRALPEERRTVLNDLRSVLEPPHDRLLRKFLGLEGGLAFLVDLREELLVHRGTDPALSSLDQSLRSILEQWFDVGLLQLQRLTWDSPASLLEKLIEYEAVHAIESWNDLRGRLGTGRRCYAFLHPGMPGEPLIFVEVALVQGIAEALPPLLDHDATRVTETDADTAIFYSISNCHRGLAGVSLGDFLIKRVVEEINHDLPNIEHFATLSPVPGFRRWLQRSLESEPSENGDRPLLGPGERHLLSPGSPENADAALRRLISGSWPAQPGDMDRVKPVLVQLVSRYLLDTSDRGRSADPVANFHLSNGASLDRVNWWANPGSIGWERGLSMMVNYRYRLRSIEENHDRYVGRSEVVVSDDVRRLTNTIPAPKSD